MPEPKDDPFEVLLYEGKSYSCGQRDVSVTWSYICRDVVHNRPVRIHEELTWSHCSPDLKDLQARLLQGERLFFYVRIESCDASDAAENDPIATVRLPITSHLVCGGLLNLQAE